ncbi:MAG: S41 family peptidase [Patescibacteria group bacterium]
MDILKKLFSKRTIAVFVGAVILVGTGGASYITGYQSGTENPKTIRIEGVANIDDPDTTIDFASFWDAWDKLKRYHLKAKNAADKDFLYSAIDGLAATFKDPNTVFFPPEEAKNFTQTMEGHFGGIGAEIGLNRSDELVIVIPLKRSPAERAGLKGGDKILEINDMKTDGITIDEAVSKIRGPVGTGVTLAVLRESWGTPRDIEIQRETIVVPTIDTEIKDEISHVRLYNFNAEAGSAFHVEGYLKSVTEGAKGMILDLRDNPGGFLEVAVNIAGWFLNRGDIVAIERFADGSEDEFRASGNEALKDMPLVIIVNENSASASEILAGAIKDHRGITIIGEHKQTYGKGTVQEVHPLSGNSGSLKITVGEWLRPSRQSIEKVGITPDLVVPVSEDDVLAGRDPALDRAFQILKTKI